MRFEHASFRSHKWGPTNGVRSCNHTCSPLKSTRTAPQLQVRKLYATLRQKPSLLTFHNRLPLLLEARHHWERSVAPLPSHTVCFWHHSVRGLQWGQVLRGLQWGQVLQSYIPFLCRLKQLHVKKLYSAIGQKPSLLTFHTMLLLPLEALHQCEGSATALPPHTVCFWHNSARMIGS